MSKGCISYDMTMIDQQTDRWGTYISLPLNALDKAGYVSQ